jgi:peptidoglycan/LPS O-acetylase OafA/YrhL
MILGITVFSSVVGTSFSTHQIIANVTMLQMLFSQQNILGVYWTLILELFFYGLCFVAFWRGRLSSPYYQVTAIVSLMLLAIAAAIIKFTTQYNGIPVGALTFIAIMYIGTLARQSLIEKNTLATRLLPPAVIFVALASPVAFYFGYCRTPEESWIANIAGFYVGLALFFFCIMRKAFTTNITIFLGWISYSVYLSHPIMLPMVWRLVDAMAWPLQIIAMPGLVAASSILLASAIYYLIEKPSIKFGHKVVGLIENISYPQIETSPSITKTAQALNR